MKNNTCVWRNSYIITTSPNPRAIFHLYFSNPLTSYTYYKAWQNYCILIGGKANNYLINCTLHKLFKMTVQPLILSTLSFFYMQFQLKIQMKWVFRTKSFEQNHGGFKRQTCVCYHKLAMVARPIFTNFQTRHRMFTHTKCVVNKWCWNV